MKNYTFDFYSDASRSSVSSLFFDQIHQLLKYLTFFSDLTNYSIMCSYFHTYGYLDLSTAYKSSTRFSVKSSFCDIKGRYSYAHHTGVVSERAQSASNQ